MNNLRTNVPGGWPIKLNDIRWLQDAMRGGFSAVFAMFPQDTVIVLSGLSLPVGVDNTVSAGIVYYNGEIYVVDEVDLDDNQYIVWDFEPVLSTESGEKILQNEAEYQAHEIRKANLLVVPDDPEPADGVRRFIWEGELHEHTKGYYNVLAAQLDLVPAGTVMLWGGTLANIPTGWELCQGQMGMFGGAFPSQAPDYRNAFVAGYNAAGPAPFNTLGAEIINVDIVNNTSPLRLEIGAYIIKNGSQLPPIFSY